MAYLYSLVARAANVALMLVSTIVRASEQAAQYRELRVGPDIAAVVDEAELLLGWHGWAGASYVLLVAGC